MSAEQWAPWAAFAFGAVNFVAGILAYRGRYRGWLILKGFFLPGWPGLASLYLGIAFMLIGAGPMVLAYAPPLLLLAHFFLLFTSLVVGIIAMFWLPAFMLPGWVRETRRKIKSGEDRLSQALAPGGALYRRLGVAPEHQPGPAPTDAPRDDDHDGHRG